MKRISKAFSLFLCLLLLTIPMHVIAADGNTTVYITKTGSKYHADGCKHLKRSKYSTTLQSAVSNGYSPCSTCHSPTLSGTSASASAPTTSSKSATPAVSNTTQTAFTPQLAVQLAYQHYLNSGLASDAALARTQANTSAIVACKSAAEVAQFVQNDLAALAAPSTISTQSASITPEQVVQQAYNTLVAGGMSPADALTHVQTNLTAILAQAGF